MFFFCFAVLRKRGAALLLKSAERDALEVATE